MIPAIKELNFPSYATLSNAVCSIEYMGQRTITTTVKIDGDIAPDFSYDWNIVFKGEKYVHPLRLPAATKSNESILSQVDLTFQHWAEYQLGRYMFFQPQTLESGAVVADKFIASVKLNLKNFCDYFEQVLRYYYGDKIIIDLNPNWAYDEEPADVDINHSYIWDVISDTFYPVYGVRWTLEATADNDNTVDGGERYVLRIGYDTEEISQIFEYGVDGGLLKVERQVQDSNIRNIIYGRGCDTNVPARYFKDVDKNNDSYPADPDWIPELANTYFAELRGKCFRDYVKGWKTNPKRQLVDINGEAITPYPHDNTVKPIAVEPYDEELGETNYAYSRGHTDVQFDPVEFVKNDASIARYGELVTGLDNNSDVYPTIQKVDSADHLDYFGSDIGRVDEVVAVEEITSDDYETEAEAQAYQVTGEQCSTTLRAVDNDSTKFEVTSAEFTIPADMSGNLVATPKLMHASHYAPQTGYELGQGKVTRYLKDMYDDTALSQMELTDTLVTVYNKETDTELLSPSGIPAGTYYYKITGKVKNTINNNGFADVTVGCEGATLTYANISNESDWQQTFDIWIKNIFASEKQKGETDNEYAERVWKPLLGTADEQTAKVCFSDGWLSTSEDYEFEVIGYPIYDTSKTYNGITSHWRITLAKSDADLDTLGVYMPSTIRNAIAGNHFYFDSVEMPHDYVLWAEEAIDNTKENKCDEVCDIDPSWVVELDKVFINQERPDISSTAKLALEALGVLKTEANGNIMLEQNSVVYKLINKLKAGCSLRLSDKRFILNEDGTPTAYITSYIQSVTYTYNEPSGKESNILPEVEIVLNNEYEVTANPIDTISSEVVTLATQVNALSRVEQIVRLVGDKLYLRKDGISDRSMSPTEFATLLTSTKFRQGAVGGSGWGFYKDNNGNWVLEADRMVLRQDLQVNTLVVNQIEGRGGMVVETLATMEVTRVDKLNNGNYRCYFDQKNGTVWNLFREDDVAYCNRFLATYNDNADLEYTDTKFYKRRIVEIYNDSVVLSATDTNGEDEPAEGDVIVQYGNYTDANRQFAIIRDAQGGGYERFLEGLDSVTATGVEYYFVGRQAGMYNGKVRFFLGNDDGYIKFEDDVLTIKGKLDVASTIGDTGKTLETYVAETVSDSVSDAIPYTISLSNEMQGVPCDSDGVVQSGYTPTTTVYIRKGNEQLTKWNVTATSKYCTTSYDASTQVLSVTAINDNAPDTIQIVITATDGNNKLSATFMLYKVKAGAAGQSPVIYEIVPEVNCVIRSVVDGTSSVNRVGCTVYAIVGTLRTKTNDKKLYAQRIGFDVSAVEATRTDGYTRGVTLSSAGSDSLGKTSNVQFTLYDDDGSTILDRADIPVLSDASELEVSDSNIALGTVHSTTISDFTNASNYIAKLYDLYVCLKTGNKIRVSFDYDIDVTYDTTQAYRIVPTITTGSAWMPVATIKISAASGHFDSGILTVPDGFSTEDAQQWIYLRMDYIQSGHITIRNLMVQKGTLATEWSPSVHDTDYLTQAILNDTAVSGGLLLTSTIKVGTQTDANTMTQATTAGLNGITSDEEGAGGGIAFWAGGDAVDAAMNSDSNVTPATTVIRHDGSAYFANNTLRLAKDVIEVGDSVILDTDGLALLDDEGNQRLRIANRTVGTDFDFENNNIVVNKTGTCTPIFSLQSKTLTTLTPGTDGLPGTLEETVDKFYTVSTSASTIINIGDLNQGSDIQLNNIQVKLEKTSYRIVAHANFRVGYYDTSGKQIFLTQYTASADFQGSTIDGYTATASLYIAGSSIHTAASYFVEVTIPQSASYGETTTKKSLTAAILVKGYVQQSYAQRTLLGSDGLLSVWGNSGILANSNGIMMRAGSVGLWVSTEGIKKLSDGLWVDATI